MVFRDRGSGARGRRAGGEKEGGERWCGGGVGRGGGGGAREVEEDVMLKVVGMVAFLLLLLLLAMHAGGKHAADCHASCKGERTLQGAAVHPSPWGAWLRFCVELLCVGLMSVLRVVEGKGRVVAVICETDEDELHR